MAEASSIRLSAPKAKSSRLCAAIQAATATTASIIIQPVAETKTGEYPAQTALLGGDALRAGQAAQIIGHAARGIAPQGRLLRLPR
jgi:hypothetical protein